LRRVMVIVMAMSVGLVGSAAGATLGRTGSGTPTPGGAHPGHPTAVETPTDRGAPAWSAPPALTATGLASSSPSLHGRRSTTVNWAGWADGTGSFRSAAASWVEPSVTCPVAGAMSAVWVGLDGLTDGTVEQGGTITECDGLTPEHDVWWEMFPTDAVQIVAAVQPGDHITAQVTFSEGTFTIAVTDATRPSASFSTHQVCGATVTCDRASAEWIVEAPGTGSGLLPLADFGKVRFSAAGVGTGGTTKPIDTPALGPERIDMVSQSGGTPLATTGTLRSKGTSFTVAWHRAR
jgi:Peptidase A4 family